MSSNLRFNKQSFKELSVPDNFLNLWIYNYFVKHKPCVTYDTYSKYCEEVLKEQWYNYWGHYDFVFGKIESFDKTFIDLGLFLESNKWLILDKSIEKNKSKFKCLYFLFRKNF